MAERCYIAIDLKSFYASVECVMRGYDPLTTNLVVADNSRTEKTICLAVSPSLKAYGIPGRPRLFEVIQQVKQINAERLRKACIQQFTGSSVFPKELDENLNLKLDFIIAKPQMSQYITWSTKIYSIYLKYIAPEDIHVYSIDEVFMDVTDYLHAYHNNPHELAMTIIHDILRQTGITATAGIGTNLYLAKVAMDIVAKHVPADKDGVRIAQLNEQSYRETLWDHQPITDFWRIGHGYARKLHSLGLDTMGDIASYSTLEYGRDYLYKLFGINAELLIDHAWGIEPTTMEAIKSYHGKRKSLGSGQVLSSPYSSADARLVTKEMADALSLDLASSHLLTDQIVLTIGYDRENLTKPEIAKKYHGKISSDYYGRKIPSHAHGTINLSQQTASTDLITTAAMNLYDRIVNPDLLIRRISITAGKVIEESEISNELYMQLDIFTDYKKLQKEQEKLAKEKKRQEAVLSIQQKYGKNSIFKGMNLLDGATMLERNGQIGGHKA